jgi:hypothetical protein
MGACFLLFVVPGGPKPPFRVVPTVRASQAQAHVAKMRSFWLAASQHARGGHAAPYGLTVPPGQWFEHRLEEDCHGGNVLARLSKEWWMITAIVIIDVLVDIASPASSHATVIATSERCAQLHQLLSLLLELPL